MSADPKRNLLFVAVLGNNTVAVLDLNDGRVVRTITGLNNPQGVAYVQEPRRLYVSNAGDGTLSIFDGDSFSQVGRLALPGDADNIRYDPASDVLYVAYGEGGIAAIDAGKDSILWSSNLPGHPESFQVESTGHLIYVNIPTSNMIAVIDKYSGKSISNHSLAGSNFPMAIDEANSRLFVATRSPPRFLVLDTGSWGVVGNLTIPGDPDDIFYDGARALVYVSCGQGQLEVIKQNGANLYAVVQSLPTGPGARTALFVPQMGAVYVGVPPSTGQEAQLLGFTIQSGATFLRSSLQSSMSSAERYSTAVCLDDDGEQQLMLVPCTGAACETNTTPPSTIGPCFPQT